MLPERSRALLSQVSPGGCEDPQQLVFKVDLIGTSEMGSKRLALLAHLLDKALLLGGALLQLGIYRRLQGWRAVSLGRAGGGLRNLLWMLRLCDHSARNLGLG